MVQGVQRIHPMYQSDFEDFSFAFVNYRQPTILFSDNNWSAFADLGPNKLLDFGSKEITTFNAETVAMTPVLGQLDTAVEWLSVHSVSVPAVPSGSAKLARPSRAQFGCLPSHNHRRSSQPEYVKGWRMANNSYLNVSLKVSTKLQPTLEFTNIAQVRP